MLDGTEFIKGKEWAHLSTAAKIIRPRTIGVKTTEEVIYYISDLGLDAEDNHIYRNCNGAANLSAIRKIVLASFGESGNKKEILKEGEPSFCGHEKSLSCRLFKNYFFNARSRELTQLRPYHKIFLVRKRRLRSLLKEVCT